MKSADSILQNCILCPRECGVNRKQGQRGRCRVNAQVRVARAALHMWEEPCISGTEGSGAVFFSGCSLGCVYCQNREISGGKSGMDISVSRLADIFLELEAQGANNINLVTAGHYVPQVIEALESAKNAGLHIPVVYNSSGYEKVETLKWLEGLVDVYLPDFKYMDPVLAEQYSSAPDYPAVARKAIREMVRQRPQPQFDRRGIMTAGVVVRHLLLPGHVREAKRVLEYLHQEYGEKIYISMMNQYTPGPAVAEDPLLHRRVTKREYERLLDFAQEIGIIQGFYQEGETAKESFIPAFDCQGVLPEGE
ncbi:MAG: radical SAM protein [Lachnospiraceae bacterium]|nr:radical SAM protein [Lachnospiraceae bacterium]